MPLCWNYAGNNSSPHYHSSSPRSNTSGHVYYMPTSPLSESALASSPDSHRRVSQVYYSESPGEARDNSFSRIRRDSTEIYNGRLLFGSSLNRSHSQSLAGSYEESLLKGRTATPCSSPLPFLSRIGVLGRGKCPTRLKCPPQINLDFTAVYYNWSVNEDSSARMESPYVGAIDIVDRLYEIPRKGQLQIVVANPNKTPCALFLIPYELCQPSQYPARLFIRHRVVSHTIPDDDGVSSSESFLKQTAHIPIVCTARNTFYLSKSIKLIFNNQSLQSGIVGSSRDESLVKTRDEAMTIYTNWATVSGDGTDQISPVLRSIPDVDKHDFLCNTRSSPRFPAMFTESALIVSQNLRPPSLKMLSDEPQRIQLRGQTNEHPGDYPSRGYLPTLCSEPAMEAVLWPEMSRSQKIPFSNKKETVSDDWTANNIVTVATKQTTQSKLTVGIKALEISHKPTG